MSTLITIQASFIRSRADTREGQVERGEEREGTRARTPNGRGGDSMGGAGGDERECRPSANHYVGYGLHVEVACPFTHLYQSMVHPLHSTYTCT